jgi:caffeoyl-CoA O-methyltransferase
LLNGINDRNFAKTSPVLDLIHSLVQSYAEQYSSPEEPLLQEVARATREQHAQAQMLSGHLQGKFLENISRLLQPRRILEIGSFTGYSALCLAAGLAPGGRLHTLELREEDARTAQENFNRSPLGEKIILHVGNALSIIPTLHEEWDMVFLDADKTGYIDYYELVLPLLRQNGLILADNVLFHGEVLQPPLSGKNAKAIQAFNAHVQQDERVEQVLLTIRDGLMLIRKK